MECSYLYLLDVLSVKTRVWFYKLDTTPFFSYPTTYLVKLNKLKSTQTVCGQRKRGADKSSRPLIGTGARHVTSLPPDRGVTHHVVAAYQGTLPSLRLSVGKFLPSPIQSVPIPSTSFFFLFDYRLRHCSRFDTYPPGAFGRNGFHGESV